MNGEGQEGTEFKKLHRVEEPAASEKKPQIPVTTLVLASVGGMLLFMGLFFLLIAGLGVRGFFVPALGVVTIANIMMLSAWYKWRRSKVRHEELHREESERLFCDYCGGMNAQGELKCRFCGAPLR